MFGRNFHRPVIVIGMHRSGTSMIARILNDSGINMGVSRDHNEESFPFLSVNQRVLESAGGSWIDPLIPSREFWSMESDISMYVNHFQLNPKRYSLFGKPRSKWIKWLHDKPWGFKDPRNTFTLEMWLSIFPKARVIHMVRNSDAVISSLMRRNKRENEVSDARLENPQFCRSLRDQYLHAADKHLMKLPLNQYIEIQYEDIIRDKKILKALGEFVEVDLTEAGTRAINKKTK